MALWCVVGVSHAAVSIASYEGDEDRGCVTKSEAAAQPQRTQPRATASEDSVVISTQHISEVVVTSTTAMQRAVVPVQVLSGRQLENLSVLSVADAMRYFAGVQIKDFGGIGGLKTVNVRSLGTNHTGVFYDGIQLGNAQNGQIDLGRFSLDNMESVSLYNGQKSNIFQTARDYSSASAVYMQSRQPHFADGKRDNLNIGMKAGSFDTYNPSVLWEHRISEAVSSQVSAEYMNTSGRYRFHYARRNGYDTTEVRRNGDVEALRAEVALFGKIDRGEWRAKAYVYNSERGLPGAAVREEPGKFRHQDRQWDTDVFMQAHWHKAFSDLYSLQLKVKADYNYLRYLSDPSLDVTTMYVDNTYRQREMYFSASHLFEITDRWSVSLANDIQWNRLRANLQDFAYPTRWQALSSVATSLRLGRATMQASLLHTFVSDKTEVAGGAAGNKSQLTPTLIIQVKPFEGEDLSIRAFYKRIFRMPTLNDLYYTFVGNKELQPEYTTQYDLGLTWQTAPDGFLRRFYVQADLYYNKVENKIVAMPTSNQFRWTMMNFGLCRILGFDLSTTTSISLGRSVSCDLVATYTYTRAKDETTPGSEFFGGQLPYIPWHSFSTVAQLSWGPWSANYSFIYTGERYESSANIPENYSKPWYTNDLSLSRTIPLKKWKLRLTAEVNNIFNQQYEVVQCYPMPGTNAKVKINVIW